MLRNKLAVITGSSRGIGKDISLMLAKNGCDVVIAGKSVVGTETLPGSIYSVAEEARKYGVNAYPIKTDLRDTKSIYKMMNYIDTRTKGADIIINNAGALWWKGMLDTPSDKYDLVNNINSRASYIISQMALPNMLKKKWGHIIMHSPPFDAKNINESLESKILNGKAAYMISKWGMSITALGIAHEFKGTGVAANTIWPSTPIKSYATINNNIGNAKMWRTPEIICDSIYNILNEDPKEFTGNCLIDEEYLMSKDENTDFTKYQCVPGYEPPKLKELNL